MISDDTLMGASLMTFPVCRDLAGLAGQFFRSERERARTFCLLKPPEPLSLLFANLGALQ